MAPLPCRPRKGTTGESRCRKASGPRFLRDAPPATKDPKTAELPKGDFRRPPESGRTDRQREKTMKIMECPRALVVLLSLAVWGSDPSFAAIKSESKSTCGATPEQAAVYFVRPPALVGKIRTAFVFADTAFLGALDNNSYFCVNLKPGRHLLWLNCSKAPVNLEAEAGETYYFEVSYAGGMSWAPGGPAGESLVESAKFHVQPTEKELATSESHLAEHFPKVQRFAAERAAARKKRLEEWPAVDLGKYSTLYVEDFQVTDSKALKPKNIEATQSSTARMAALLRGELGSGPFEAVHEGGIADDGEASVVLRVEVTKYRGGALGAPPPAPTPGLSLTFSMEMETLSFGYQVRLIDGVSGEVLAAFSDKRGPGAPYNIERNVPLDLSLYLKRCKSAAKS